jgi:hypothetical protein
MARPLYTRIERESPIRVEQRPLNISLEPTGVFGFRLKGARSMIFLPMETAYRMALAESGRTQRGMTRNVVVSPIPLNTPAHQPSEALERQLLTVMKKEGGPVNITKLRHALREAGPALKSLIVGLESSKKIQKAKGRPLYYELKKAR